MDAFVTARVPQETKDQAGQILKSIGATQSQLINSAYEYLLKKGQLPYAAPGKVAEGRRSPDPSLLSELAASIKETTFTLSGSALEDLDGADYKALIAAGRAADYEALS